MILPEIPHTVLLSTSENFPKTTESFYSVSTSNIQILSVNTWVHFQKKPRWFPIHYSESPAILLPSDSLYMQILCMKCDATKERFNTSGDSEIEPSWKGGEIGFWWGEVRSGAIGLKKLY